MARNDDTVREYERATRWLFPIFLATLALILLAVIWLWFQRTRETTPTPPQAPAPALSPG